MPKTFVRELSSVIDLTTVGPNHVIFHEGEGGNLFYVIMSGSVDIKVNSVDQRGALQQTKLINLGEGAHFGDLALIKGKSIYSICTRYHRKFLSPFHV